jgi:hypothetical protein
MLDQTNLITSLQAMVIYEILLFFPSKTSVEIPFVEPYIFSSISKLISYISVNDLVLTEERTSQWKDWVNVNSKRRSTQALYLLHRAYTLYHDLPSSTSQELAFIPVPTAEVLWQARSEEEWQPLYARWLSDWERYCYWQGELF